MPISPRFLTNIRCRYFSLNIWVVYDQLELDWCIFDQNWAKTRPLHNQIFQILNAIDRPIVHCLKKNKCLSILNSIGFHSTSCLKGEKLSLFESIYFTNFCFFFKQWLPLGRFRKVLNSTPKLHYHFLVHRLVITRNRYTELCYLEGRRPLLPAAKLQIHTPEWCDDHVVSNKYWNFSHDFHNIFSYVFEP